MQETVKATNTGKSLGSHNSVTILMPAHNEEESMRWLLPRLVEALNSLDLPYEAIVVDDGSTDQTAQVAAQYGLRVVKNPLRRGKGASIRQGLRYANGNWLVTMDADGSNVPSDLPSLLRPVIKGKADVVVGSRFKQRLPDSAQEPFIRRLGNAFFNLAIFLSTGFPVTDSQSGYRAFSVHVLISVPTFSEGFEWETEVLLKVVKRGFRIVEVPIHYKKRVAGVSSLALIGDSIKFLTLIIRDLFGTLS